MVRSQTVSKGIMAISIHAPRESYWGADNTDGAPAMCQALDQSLHALLIFMLVVAAVVQLLSCVQLFVTPWTAAHQASCPSPSSRACSNSCPLSWQCHATISSSVTPFSSHLQSFPAPESFQMSQFFALGSQSIGASASASVLPVNIQD